MWRVAVSRDQLSDVAATLGADVPFFLSGGTALGLGRGDEIYLLADWPRHWVVLLVPDFGVSSRQAYQWYDARQDLGRDVSECEPHDVPGPWPSRTVGMMNDLERAIALRHPEIDRMKAALRSAGALASAMSGSGSTVFGLFQQRPEALAASGRLSESGYQVILTESLSRGEYARQCRPVARRGRRVALGVEDASGDRAGAATGGS